MRAFFDVETILLLLIRCAEIFAGRDPDERPRASERAIAADAFSY